MMWFQKGSYTIEATLLIPTVCIVLMMVIGIAVDFVQESANREEAEAFVNLSVVEDFYTYQVLEEIGEEIMGD